MLPGRPFLCLRRGVSGARRMYLIMFPFSLPTQRCFCHPSNHYCLYWAFLCLRRGVSTTGYQPLPGSNFSLPTQRCFRRIRIRSPASPLFSAYAEVFLEDALPTSVSASFLCLRRGVSRYLAKRVLGFDISLPTQRCFQAAEREVRRKRLFSAYAEVFPISMTSCGSWLYFSLPTQRCFWIRAQEPQKMRLFSAYAEVFPGESGY